MRIGVLQGRLKSLLEGPSGSAFRGYKKHTSQGMSGKLGLGTWGTGFPIRQDLLLCMSVCPFFGKVGNITICI